MRRILTAALACMAVSACGQQDWRAQTIAQAEAKMRQETTDPAAQFARVQVTGDDKTGQTCGYVSARFATDGLNHTARFIVYIDNSAGPYVDGALGRQALSSEDFEQAWRSDCIKEGYTA
jgi:hypothetical protein